jgi:MFS family permease
MKGPFADARFRRLLVGQSLSNFGDTALYLTLGIWVKELTGSNAAAGGVFLAMGAPTLLAPLSGHLADRVRRRPLLIATNSLAGALVLSLLAVRDQGQSWLIYGVAFGYGLAATILSSAGTGLRKAMLHDEDAAAANTALQTIGQGVRIVAPLVGTGLFVAFGGPAVAILDAATFAAAIAALVSINVSEPKPEAVPRGSFRRDVTAGFRHVLTVPLLTQITLVSACAFSVIGLNETVIFAVIDQGLHRSPSFFGLLNSVQGAASVVAGICLPWLLRRVGIARVTGLALGAFALAAAAYTIDSVAVCMAAAVGDGCGLVWLAVTLGTATQIHTPPRLQGRVTAAWTTLVLTPQTLSIAAGTALITVVNYRLLLLVMTVVMAACALLLLIRPAPEPTKAVPEAAAALPVP